MLEEKNDNLPTSTNEADGKVEAALQDMQDAVVESNLAEETIEVKQQEFTAEEPAVVSSTEANEELSAVEEVAEGQAVAEEIVTIELDTILAESANPEDDSPVEMVTDETPDEIIISHETLTIEDSPVSEEAPKAEVISEEIVAIESDSPTDQPNETVIIEDQIVAAITDVNAAESEDETLRHDIPMEDYETMSMEELVVELESLTAAEKVMAVKDHVEELRKSFIEKFNHFIEEKRNEYHSENPDATEDFHYHFPLKTKFDQLYNQYRDRKNKHFKSIESNLQSNLETRLAIVEELKNLINPQDNIKDTLKHFNLLRERWRNSGPIPKDKYNHVWNNYHFHVENFYDYLHLDREARDVDFKHNLEQKQKIIARVEELLHESDINKAFRELQDLHRIWKEEIGPVSREQREEVWTKFRDLTKEMHDKREHLFANLRATEQANLDKKNEIISKIEELAKENVHSHNAWTAQVAKVEALRNDFFATGRVPAEVNEETWTKFKNAVRSFNVLKNSFYKDIKKEQNNNLQLKQALVTKAQELQDSTDFAATTPVMKQIQEEWKTIGHVPRKFSDQLWKDFRAACNIYFENFKAHKNQVDPDEAEAYEKKKSYLESLKGFEMTGNHKTDLDAIKAHIENWKSFGKVPEGKRHIEGKFNKILDVLFEKLSLSKKESDLVRFSNRVGNLSENNDTRKLENEKIFLIRKIEEVQQEIFQLENNIQFFSNTKNAKKESSIVLEVRKNIAKHRENLDVLKEKLKKLREVKPE